MIVKYYFNRDTYNGAVAKDKGKLKQQVYEENLLHKRIAEESELNLMLMRSSKAQTVGRRGVHLTISGQRIDYFNKELLDMQGKKYITGMILIILVQYAYMTLKTAI